MKVNLLTKLTLYAITTENKILIVTNYCKCHNKNTNLHIIQKKEVYPDTCYFTNCHYFTHFKLNY